MNMFLSNTGFPGGISIHIHVAASQEYVNTYSTRRANISRFEGYSLYKSISAHDLCQSIHTYMYRYIYGSLWDWRK